MITNASPPFCVVSHFLIICVVFLVSFNVETLQTRQMGKVVCWDVGGKDKIRSLWRHYYNNTQGIVFCIDSTDYGKYAIVVLVENSR